MSKEGDPGVPKKGVFELDKDERWQARLDEARARREVALREKAAGIARKPRPKPWEIEGSDVEEPKKIDPIIQERGDDKFDFADRLESIRENQTDEPDDLPGHAAQVLPDDPPADPPEAVRPVEAPSEPAYAPAPERRARPQPSLILPGAPDVADIAARYAETLDAKDGYARAPDFQLDDPVAPRPEAESAQLIPLPAGRRRAAPDKPLSRAERRRGVRPMGMAYAVLLLAAFPFTTKAPPLEQGPEMPIVQRFGSEPALGVTWSLSGRPAETAASAWRPVTRAPELAPLSFEPSPVRAASADLPALDVPPAPSAPGVDWQDLSGLDRTAEGDALFVPDGQQSPVVGFVGPNDLPAPKETLGAETAPVTIEDTPVVGVPSVIVPVQPDRRPTPVERPALAPPANPLRVTVLYPVTAGDALAGDIGARIEDDGHELVNLTPSVYSVSTRNLRFFHEEDRAEAERLATRYDAELRDFTFFQPKPLPGTAELWLSGRPSVRPAATPVEAPAANPSVVPLPEVEIAPQAAPETVVPPTAIQNPFLERLFDRLGLSTELPRDLENGSN
jgi:hypothetical protein